jgi:hypothetical protein
LGVVRISERAVNSILAELLGKKVGEGFHAILGKAIVSTPRSIYSDVYFVEYYGVKVVFEAKVCFQTSR